MVFRYVDCLGEHKASPCSSEGQDPEAGRTPSAGRLPPVEGRHAEVGFAHREAAPGWSFDLGPGDIQAELGGCWSGMWKVKSFLTLVLHGFRR